MLQPGDALEYYCREDIKKALLAHATNREVGVRFGDAFGSRPDMIAYGNDVAEFAKKGATSFHISEERWHNPMDLAPGMRKSALDKLRSGWDFILDIDCPIWEYAKLITSLLVQGLQDHGITSISVKFSGNKGFHIGVPFEAFPSTFGEKPIETLFPEAPRKMAEYLVHYINSEETNFTLSKKILSGSSIQEICEKTGKPKDELVKKFCSSCHAEREDTQENTLIKFLCPSCGTEAEEKEDLPFRKCEKCTSMMEKITIKGGARCMHCGASSTYSKFDPSSILEVDTVLLSSRHLYRMAYSLHEKSGLASVIISPHKVEQFEKPMAHPAKVKGKRVFLDVTQVQKDEALQLLEKSYAFAPIQEKKGYEDTKEFAIPKEAIPREFFPPCIQRLLEGVEDGRKRGMFILINFLTTLGYDHAGVRTIMDEWNAKNAEPLRDTLLGGHIRYHKDKGRIMMPPNCVSSYYKEMGICHPDNMCAKIKNPVQYAKRKSFFAQKDKKVEKKEEKQVENSSA